MIPSIQTSTTRAVALRLLTCAGTVFFTLSEAKSLEHVVIVTGSRAPDLEQLAARELESQFLRLFKDIDTSLVHKLGGNEQFLVLLGSPDTNPHIKKIMGKSWPDISDQGLVVKSFNMEGKRGLVVGGGSPVATLWAVYELGRRHGIRYLLRDDVYPQHQVPLSLAKWDITLEPQLRTRTWRTVNDFAMGPESWGLADHQRVLRQLAKLKFNHIMLSLWPWQPFIHYEFGGVKKQTATFWFGEKYRIDGDTPGKKIFGGATFFENPDFAGIKDYDELSAAGVNHIRGIIDTAHQLGMQVGIAFYPLEFPREFQAALPGSRVAHQLKNLTITPSGAQRIDDPTLKALASTKVRAYLETYPTIDALYFRMSEFPEWNEHAVDAWDSLMAASPGKQLSLNDVVESARSRNTLASGKRGETAVKGNVVSLAFLQELLQEENLLRRQDGQNVDVVVTNIDPSLASVLERVLPPHATALHFVDYTARRVAQNRKLLSDVPVRKVKSRLIMTLADDNVGVLPQTVLTSLSTLMDHLRENQWDGFSTRYWMLGELDPVIYFLSRAAWDADATARSIHDEFWQALTEHSSTAARLWLGWEHLEKATELIDSHQIGFGFPVPGMLMKHYQSGPEPEWWKAANDHYTQLLIELYRTHSVSSPGGRDLLFYYAKRATFATEYLAAVKAVHEAAVARDAGDREKAIESLESAMEQTYNSMTTLADVARDGGDRGLIAILNAYAYQPLKAEYERLIEEDESEP